MKIKTEAFEVYPAGVYVVQCVEVVEQTESQYGAQLRFKFQISGGQLDGSRLTGWCSKSGSIKSKFYEWYSALSGTSPKPGEDMDTDLLIGRSAQAVVKIKVREDSTRKNVIDSLLPVSGNSNAKSSPQSSTREDLLRRIRNRVIELNDKTQASDHQLKQAAASLNTLCGGDDDLRKRVVNFLFDRESMRLMTVAECRALTEWIDIQKINGEWIPSAHSIAELESIKEYSKK